MSVAQNSCHGNAGCLATGPQNLHFMIKYFKNENFELRNRHIHSSRPEGGEGGPLFAACPHPFGPQFGFHGKWKMGTKFLYNYNSHCFRGTQSKSAHLDVNCASSRHHIGYCYTIAPWKQQQSDVAP